MLDASRSISTTDGSQYSFCIKARRNHNSREELVAEMGSAFLCAEAGIESTLDNSAAYLKGWLGALKGDARLIVTASSAAQRATDFILGLSAQESAEGEPASEQ